MAIITPEFEAACRTLLDRFFAAYPDAEMRGRAEKALRQLVSKGEVPAGKPRSWAGGIVYAVSSRGVGVPGVLNRDLEDAFGVTMGEIYNRVAVLKTLLGPDLPSPPLPEFLEGALPLPGGEEFTLRDEANAIVAYAFRNGPIEDLHAGTEPEPPLSPGTSRISDEEMKVIMLAACKAVENLLREKRDDPDNFRLKMIDYNRRYCRKWER